jgi:hypothetical protein
MRRSGRPFRAAAGLCVRWLQNVILKMKNKSHAIIIRSAIVLYCVASVYFTGPFEILSNLPLWVLLIVFFHSALSCFLHLRAHPPSDRIAPSFTSSRLYGGPHTLHFAAMIFLSLGAGGIAKQAAIHHPILHTPMMLAILCGAGVMFGTKMYYRYPKTIKGASEQLAAQDASSRPR